MKVKKKLKKKTGKRVEIVRNEDEEVAKDDSHESDKLVVMYQFAVENDCCIETEATMILSDENPHACALM